MPPDNDSTRPASDIVEAGVPATTEMPSEAPPGWEAEEEPPPLDVPQGVETWGTTSEEELTGEPLSLRVLREEPDVAERASAEGVRLLEPGAEAGVMDDEPDSVGEVDVQRNTGDTLGPEESAMRLEDEPAGLTYDRSPGYLDDDE